MRLIVRKIKSNKTGITFVEMLISILMLGIIVGPLLGSFSMSKISAARARHRIEAMNYARSAMELLKGEQIGIFPWPPASGQIKDLNPNYSSTVEDSGLSGINKITVTITWDEQTTGNTVNLSERLVTYIRQ